MAKTICGLKYSSVAFTLPLLGSIYTRGVSRVSKVSTHHQKYRCLNLPRPPAIETNICWSHDQLKVIAWHRLRSVTEVFQCPCPNASASVNVMKFWVLVLVLPGGVDYQQLGGLRRTLAFWHQAVYTPIGLFVSSQNGL